MRPPASRDGLALAKHIHQRLEREEGRIDESLGAAEFADRTTDGNIRQYVYP